MIGLVTFGPPRVRIFTYQVSETSQVNEVPGRCSMRIKIESVRWGHVPCGVTPCARTADAPVELLSTFSSNRMLIFASCHWTLCRAIGYLTPGASEECAMTVTVIKLDDSHEHLSDDAINMLRSRLRGELVVSDDPQASIEPRPVWNAMHVDRPAIAVRCVGTADVVDAVNFARDHGLLVAVRGGGHSVAGLSTVRDGMLIDLSAMRGVQVDPTRRLVRVQGGAVLGDVDRETQAFGLATPLGRVSDTGVAGLTLGGGYGHLGAKYGLSCDNVVEAQVVCADGQVRTASADSHPDLYWAIRGGGGNFGVVTSFTFRLHPVGPMVGFAGVFYTRWRTLPTSNAGGATM